MKISQVHRCILWILWVILQVCFSDLYSSVSKWRLREEWANNISGNFAKFSPNCTYCVFHVVLYSGLTLYELMYFC
jgi:hypothetical protein